MSSSQEVRDVRRSDAFAPRRAVRAIGVGFVALAALTARGDTGDSVASAAESHDATVAIEQEWVCKLCFNEPATPTTWVHYFDTEEEELESQLPGNPPTAGPSVLGVSPATRGEDPEERKCRADITTDEPGCHDADHMLGGRCDELHAPAPCSQGLYALVRHYRGTETSAATLISAIDSSKGAVFYNAAREAVQVVDCQGRVVGHISVSSTTVEEFRARGW